MPASWSRESVDKRKRLAAEFVFNLLPLDGSEIQWSKLKEQAQREGLSTATLAAHLKDLTKKNFVARHVVSSTYPPKVYYSKRNLSKGQKILLSPILPRNLAKAHASGYDMDVYIETIARQLFTQHMCYIYNMFSDIFLVPKVLEEPLTEITPKISRKAAHEYIDKFTDVFIRPTFHNLLDFCYLPDPRNGKPVFRNKRILQEFDRLYHFVLDFGSQELPED